MRISLGVNRLETARLLLIRLTTEDARFREHSAHTERLYAPVSFDTA